MNIFYSYVAATESLGLRLAFLATFIMDSAAAAAAVGSLGYVREFTRHATDVLWNLNELRLRGVLTDVTLLVGGRALRAHKAVLIACSGFFYSIFRGRAGVGMDLLSLPGGPEAGGFAPLLDFMYTSRLLLSPANAPAVLAAATYLQMDHVVEACHRFIQASYEPIGTSLQPLDAESQAPLMSAAPPEGSPHRFEGHPDPPTESHSCFHGPPIPDSPPSLGPSPCNWKKYKFIILNSRMAQAGTPAGKADATAEPTGSAKPASGEEASSSSGEEGSCYGTGSRLSPALDPPLLLMLPSQRKLGPPSEASCPRPGNNFFNYQNCEGRPGCPAEVESRALTPLSLGNEDKPYKCQLCRCAFRYKGNLASHRTVHTGGTPSCTRADSHWGEALSLSYLWNSLSSPADTEEPRAHPYWGETLSLRAVQPAFPPQESTSPASSTETWCRHQHQSPLPCFEGPLLRARLVAQLTLTFTLTLFWF
ncbi:B-cell CLL/lymphoma 6 member B protein isoform 2-T2 [Sarcophilus harrisii]